MFTGLWSVLAGVAGAGAGLLQGIIEKKQDTKRFQVEKELDNKRIETEGQISIEIAKTGIDIEKYKSIIAFQEANKAQYEATRG